MTDAETLTEFYRLQKKADYYGLKLDFTGCDLSTVPFSTVKPMLVLALKDDLTRVLYHAESFRAIEGFIAGYRKQIQEKKVDENTTGGH